jgi:uncharacterized protein YbjT (DUF2867 family)
LGMAPQIVRAEGIMRLTVFGATGGIGTEVVRQALARSHEVIAVVRDPARLAVPPAATLTVVTADVMDPPAIKPALDGADAVASALGPRRGGPSNVLTESCRLRNRPRQLPVPGEERGAGGVTPRR